MKIASTLPGQSVNATTIVIGRLIAREGDEIIVNDKLVTITSVKELTLGEIAVRHHDDLGYESNVDFVEAWQAAHPSVKFTTDSKKYLIQFKSENNGKVTGPRKIAQDALQITGNPFVPATEYNPVNAQPEAKASTEVSGKRRGRPPGSKNKKAKKKIVKKQLEPLPPVPKPDESFY